MYLQRWLVMRMREKLETRKSNFDGFRKKHVKICEQRSTITQTKTLNFQILKQHWDNK